MASEGMAVRLPRTAIEAVDRVKDELQARRGGRWGRGEAVRELAEDWLRRNRGRAKRRGR